MGATRQLPIEVGLMCNGRREQYKFTPILCVIQLAFFSYKVTARLREVVYLQSHLTNKIGDIS